SLPKARAGDWSEAREPTAVYERGSTLVEALRHVTKDLAIRVKEEGGTADLLLVVDPTPTLRDEIDLLAALVPVLAGGEPAGMRIGMLGIDGEPSPPRADPTEAQKALLALTLQLRTKAKNVHAAIRQGVRLLRRARGPTALVLMTAEDSQGEDDVEATRDMLLNAGVAFYAIAPEAAFEGSWNSTKRFFAATRAGLAVRTRPEARRAKDESLYYGGDAAFPLVPRQWERNLAQLEFLWGRPPPYPVPSGFGNWALASLAWSTGGRYFLHDDRGRATAKAPPRGRGRQTLLYDIGRTNRFAPDLRPRHRILKALGRNPRARAIVRIGQLLADPSCPVLEESASLELQGTGLVMRSARPVASLAAEPFWLEEMDDVRKALAFVQRRLDHLDLALRWWRKANERRSGPRAPDDTLSARVDADFDLLGAFLEQVRFQWLDRRSALRSIKPSQVTVRRVRLRVRPLATDKDGRPKMGPNGDRERNEALAALWFTRRRLAKRYEGTPWALILAKQRILTCEIDVQPRPRKVPKRGSGKGGGKPEPVRPPPPPYGPLRGSGSDAPATPK
ncbi:MAG: hypothetical protein ACC662_05935, partial [Planctomycetota bacterium]